MLSGCATYRDAAFPSGHVQSEVAGDQVAIEPGSKARVMLVSGEKLTGTVVSVTESELVLAQTSEPGLPDRMIARSDIAFIAIEHKSYMGPVIAVALLVVVVTVATAAARAASNPSNWVD
jgi:hypothetical protein